MKALSIILAFLVLLLSAQPVCIMVSPSGACVENCCSEGNKTDTDTSHNDDCKSCNPFQVCGCCAFSVVVPVQFEFSSMLSFTCWQKFESNYTPALCHTIIPGCWQPPQVG